MKKTLKAFGSVAALSALFLISNEAMAAVKDVKELSSNIVEQGKAGAGAFEFIIGLIGFCIIGLSGFIMYKNQKRQEGIGGPVAGILIGVFMMTFAIFSAIVANSTVGESVDIESKIESQW